MARRFLASFRHLRWETYAWLLYSLPFLFASFDRRLSTLETVAMLGGYAVFLALYFAAQFVRDARILWIVAAFNVLAIAFTRHNPGAGTFFIYGAASLHKGFAPRQAALGLAVQVIVATLLSVALGMPWWYYGMIAIISSVIGAVTIQADINEAKDARLRLAHAEVERLAKLAERERIARDLHDLLGHTLSVIVLKSELARKLAVRDSARAEGEMAEVERIARDGLADVRQAITGYRASGLAAEIDRVREALISAGIDAIVDSGAVPLPPAKESALSLALREAATNVIRHAGATRCQIRLHARDGLVFMEIEDNGRGGNAPFGNGLTGMRERIQGLGGALRRETGDGTRLLIELPI